MSFGLRIEADVREEMRKAGDWYEARETGVGGRFAVASRLTWAWIAKRFCMGL